MRVFPQSKRGIWSQPERCCYFTWQQHCRHGGYSNSQKGVLWRIFLALGSSPRTSKPSATISVCSSMVALPWSQHGFIVDTHTTEKNFLFSFSFGVLNVNFNLRVPDYKHPKYTRTLPLNGFSKSFPKIISLGGVMVQNAFGVYSGTNRSLCVLPQLWLRKERDRPVGVAQASFFAAAKARHQTDGRTLFGLPRQLENKGRQRFKI